MCACVCDVKISEQQGLPSFLQTMTMNEHAHISVLTQGRVLFLSRFHGRTGPSGTSTITHYHCTKILMIKKEKHSRR